jgi:hypothetical protein
VSVQSQYCPPPPPTPPPTPPPHTHTHTEVFTDLHEFDMSPHIHWLESMNCYWLLHSHR